VVATNSRVYTAFGELVEMTGAGQTRYGYAGAWGYQEHDADGPDNSIWDGYGCACGAQIGRVLPFLHVGWRYYDPATGRFLQRDPAGIDGGLNVYQYADATPTALVDPSGEAFIYPTAPNGGTGGMSGPGIKPIKPPWWGKYPKELTGKINGKWKLKNVRGVWRYVWVPLVSGCESAGAWVAANGGLAMCGGVVVAGAVAGTAIGVALDQEFGISDRIGRWAGNGCPSCFLPERWGIWHLLD